MYCLLNISLFFSQIFTDCDSFSGKNCTDKCVQINNYLNKKILQEDENIHLERWLDVMLKAMWFNKIKNIY